MPRNTDGNRATAISKTLSYRLRHRLDAAALELDAKGWADANRVLDALAAQFPGISEHELATGVAENEKRRFMLRAGRIRANQGRSLAVVPGFRPVAPPPLLYHGTMHERRVRIRRSGGLSKMPRHYVRLSPDIQTARVVAERHRRETPLILRVDAALQMTGQAFSPVREWRLSHRCCPAPLPAGSATMTRSSANR